MKLFIKRFFSILIFFCFDFLFFSESKISSFKLQNEIPVFVRHEESSNFKTLSVVVSGGINYYSYEESGLEKAVFDLIPLGSKNYSYQELIDFEYRTRSSIFSRTTKNGSVFSLNCIDYYFDKTFDIFEDAFFNPLFTEKEFTNLKNDYILSIQQMMNTPVNMLIYYATKMIFENHPYSISSTVLPESIENITLSKIKTYYNSLLNSKRIAIIATGDFNIEELKLKLNNQFGKIPKKEDLKVLNFENVAVSGNPAVFIHPTAKKSGEVIRFFKAPSPTDDDFYDFEIASNIYSDVLFNVVREHFGDCYTPQASSTGGKVSLGYELLSSVSNIKDFAKHLKIARNIMQNGNIVSGKDNSGNFILEPISKRIESYKNSYINSKFVGEQTLLSLNLRMAYSYLNYSDIKKSEELFERVKTVSADSVQTAFNKYFVNETSRYFAVVAEDEENIISFEEK